MFSSRTSFYLFSEVSSVTASVLTQLFFFFAPINVITFLKIFPKRPEGHMLPCGPVWLRHVLPYAALVLFFFFYPCMLKEEKKAVK